MLSISSFSPGRLFLYKFISSISYFSLARLCFDILELFFSYVIPTVPLLSFPPSHLVFVPCCSFNILFLVFFSLQTVPLIFSISIFFPVHFFNSLYNFPSPDCSFNLLNLIFPSLQTVPLTFFPTTGLNVGLV